MPTYDYICTSCEHVFEVFQSITAEPVKTCPKCGKEVKRKIGAGAGLVFKGSGFYITDYKSKPGSSDDKEKSTKTDKKPEKTKESAKEKSTKESTPS
ncbi:MAG: zinc ribbon domain-containing protein [Caldithrix sp.]|nr:zinc ribbon domain-containing protein [Caldithrix sp.]